MGAFRCGYVAILGKPNVGKSTLLNVFLGQKIAIVSAKPQTTRERLRGIFTDDQRQIIFVDTPGLIDPKDRFNEYLLGEAREALNGVDVVLHVVAVDDANPLSPEVMETLRRARAPKLLVLNKIDLTPPGGSIVRSLEGIGAGLYDERFAICATQGAGVADLFAAVCRRLPEGPPFYEPDQVSDRDLRYLVAELAREKILDLIHQEIPYGVATRTEEFREGPDHKKTFIAITIFVERESQRGIVIGRDGAMIKRIGQEARQEIERLVGGPVYLELSVKVRKNWRKDEHALQDLGYAPARHSRGPDKRRQ